MIGDDDDRYVCHACIGDAFLKAEIKSEQDRHFCMICGKNRKALLFDDLCERVHLIISEEFEQTASQPESWAMYDESDADWERDGDTIDEVLYEVLECEEPLLDTMRTALSDQYYSYDDAKMGFENPYGEDVRYHLVRPNSQDFSSAWSQFESEIRTQARFFSSSAESSLAEIFNELPRFRNPNRPFIRNAGPGTGLQSLFRARRAFGNSEISKILEHPALELGPPPSRYAGSGRMNPRWISMFYGALDPETCVAEIRAPVGGAVVLARFTLVRKLRLLDLDALRHLFVTKASFFDSAYRRLRENAHFLGQLVSIMSRPVLKADEEDYHYLPTQAVAEYLSERVSPRLDGLIYPSTQRGGDSQNVVLFRRASLVEPDGTASLISDIDFGWRTEDDSDTDVTIWTKRSRKRATKAWDWSLADAADNKQGGENKPALRIELDSIQIRDIQAVSYVDTRRAVRRFKKPTRKKVPF